jgi:5-methylcytosine-specific restriction endonuclease McrA
MSARSRKGRRRRESPWYRGCKQIPTVIPQPKTPKADDTAFYQSSHWRALRAAVLERDDHICQYCGDGAIQADHVKPRRKGGPDTMANLVACCTSCNRVAGDRVFASVERKKAWLLRTRGKGDRLFPTKRARQSVVIVVEPPPSAPAYRLRTTVDGALRDEARQRDQNQCIVCRTRCHRVIRVSEHRELALNNVATMCTSCERAARTLPPGTRITREAVLARRKIGI